MVSIMAGPGQNMNMNNVGRALSPRQDTDFLGEQLKNQLYSCKKRLGMNDGYVIFWVIGNKFRL